MKIIEGKETEYAKYVSKNDDPYGKACVVAGEKVGELLDQGKTPQEAEEGVKGQELTGFMVGAAISGVVHFNPRGSEMKVWWNKENPHGEPDDMSGTNNPAIITLGN